MDKLTLEQAQDVEQGDELVIVTGKYEGEECVADKELDGDHDIHVELKSGDWSGYINYESLGLIGSDEIKEILQEELKAESLSGRFEMEFVENGYVVKVELDEYEKEIVVEDSTDYGKGIKMAVDGIVKDIVEKVRERAKVKAEIEQAEQKLAELKGDLLAE